MGVVQRYLATGSRALVLCVLTAGLALGQTAAPQFSAGGPPPRFDPVKMINQRLSAFEAQDKSSPPPRQAVLLVGSSIFAQWEAVAEHMAPIPVFNRAIGGTTTDQQLQYIDQLVLQYQPRVVVYYCGSNDVNEGIGAEVIANNFKLFAQRIAKELPATRIIVTSVLRAPQKQNKWNIVDDANARLAAYAASNPRQLTYVDLNPAVFNASGAPRMELYQDDQLHYKPPAYEAFARIVKPVLQLVWGR